MDKGGDRTVIPATGIGQSVDDRRPMTITQFPRKVRWDWHAGGLGVPKLLLWLEADRGKMALSGLVQQREIQTARTSALSVMIMQSIANTLLGSWTSAWTG